MAKCVWYVSDFCAQWGDAVTDSLAAALSAKGVELQVYVEGGTGGFTAGPGVRENVVSWNALTFFERWKIILFRGRLWHLWGKTPSWWKIVRLRARTVHTSVEESPEWAGHPTRLFAEQALKGETLIKPLFEVKVSMAGDRDAQEDSVAVLTDDGPESILKAVRMTLQGFPAVARKSRILDRYLGKGGYIAVEEDAEKIGNAGDAEKAWDAALAAARGSEGRAASAVARRFLKENYPASEAADSLISLYRTAAG